MSNQVHIPQKLTWGARLRLGALRGLDDVVITEVASPDSPCPCCLDLDSAAAVAFNTEHGGHKKRSSKVRDGAILVTRLWSDLTTWAASGTCDLCPVLIDVLEFFGLDPLAGDGQGRIPVKLKIPIEAGNPELVYFDDHSMHHVQLYIARGAAWKSIQPLPDICTHHLSDQSLSFIRSCMQTCLDDHPLCRRREEGLPARILDVGLTDNDAIRLVDFVHIPPSPSTFNRTTSTTSTGALIDYMALSYCWGDGVNMKTTQDTLDAIRAGVDLSALPRSYADAVALARGLGIRYLWIDALCIIQDAHEDWEAESSKLAGVYANAALTVAATSSPSADRTFLRRRFSSGPDDPIFDEFESDGDDAVFFSKRLPDGETLLRARLITKSGIHSKWEGSTNVQPPGDRWSRRGWTLQEQLLSTRMLSFSPSEMQWTCQEAALCECRSRLNVGRLFGAKPFSQITQPSEAFRFWHKVVENYSARRLTNLSDKLMAISGVVAQLLPRTQSQYAAGLWVDNIHWDLLWRRTKPARRPPRPEYMAPSYSWASVEGEVDYYCFRNGKWPYTPAATVLSVETDVSPTAPLGKVEGGRLTIRGPMSAGYFEAFPGEDSGVWLSGIKLRGVADTLLECEVVPGPDGVAERTVCRMSPPDLSNDSSASDDPHRSMAGANQTQSRTRCWALRLGSYVDDKEHEFLILGRSPKRPNDFERIGLFTHYCADKADDAEFSRFMEGEEVATITLV